MKFSKTAALLAIAASAIFCTSVQAQIYKWVDEDGVVHYADQPQHKDAEPSQIESSRTNRAAARDSLAAALNLRNEQSERFQESRNPTEPEVSPEEAERMAELRRESCDAARRKMTQFTQARRLYKLASDGAKAYLTEEETLEARAEVQAAITEFCN